MKLGIDNPWDSGTWGKVVLRRTRFVLQRSAYQVKGVKAQSLREQSDRECERKAQSSMEQSN